MPVAFSFTKNGTMLGHTICATGPAEPAARRIRGDPKVSGEGVGCQDRRLSRCRCRVPVRPKVAKEDGPDRVQLCLAVETEQGAVELTDEALSTAVGRKNTTHHWPISIFRHGGWSNSLPGPSMCNSVVFGHFLTP